MKNQDTTRAPLTAVIAYPFLNIALWLLASNSFSGPIGWSINNFYRPHCSNDLPCCKGSLQSTCNVASHTSIRTYFISNFCDYKQNRLG